MHIPQPKFTQAGHLEIINDLTRLIQQPSADQLPPCPNCKQTTKVTDCSPKCSGAAEALSEDPNLHPIEPNIVPLVFELTSMRLVQTCWSCEGHASFDGGIFKMPQISFYTEKPFYAQLINMYLKKIHWKKQIQYPWEVCLSDFGQTLEITYTIKCDLSCIDNPTLSIMQSDLQAMAKDFSTNIKNYAQELISQINNQSSISSNPIGQ